MNVIINQNKIDDLKSKQIGGEEILIVYTGVIIFYIFFLNVDANI